MRLWRFTLILEGPDLLEGNALDLLVDAGCDDASFGWTAGRQEAGFDREAQTLEEAVRSAVLAVESIGGIEVVELVDDSAVALPEIASCSNRSDDDALALIDGRVGPGGFPQPYSLPEEADREWLWRDVAAWFAQALGEDVEVNREQPFAAIAKLIEARHHYRKQDPAKRREIEALLSD